MERSDEPDASEAQLEEFLGEFEDLMAADPEQALSFVLGVDKALENQPLTRMAKAHAIWAARGAKEAHAEFERVIAEQPDFADAHYALAEVCAEIGDETARTRHLLKVLELDRADDLQAEFNPKAYEATIADAAHKTLRSLPSPFRERLSGIPVLLEERPNESLVRDGFDPRALGMFEGPTLGEQAGEDIPLPTRIVLFSANLPAACSDEAELREEVEVTVLHEIGHYFGLEEEDLARLGLD